VHEGSDLLDEGIVLENAVNIQGDDRFERVTLDSVYSLLSTLYSLGRSGCLPSLAFCNVMAAGLKLNRSGIA